MFRFEVFILLLHNDLFFLSPSEIMKTHFVVLKICGQFVSNLGTLLLAIYFGEETR